MKSLFKCLAGVLPACLVVLNVVAVPAHAVDYPGPPPGPVRATCSATGATLENDSVAMRWTFADERLRPESVSHLQSSTDLSLAGSECFYLLLGQTPEPGTRRLNASDLKLADRPELKRLEPNARSVRLGKRFPGWELSARLVSAAPDVEILWRAVLRDGANYIRQQITLRSQGEPVEVVEAVLLELHVPQAEVAGKVDGSPIVSDRMFFGVEHPASTSRIVDSGVVRCSYPCNTGVAAGEALTLSSVIGVVPARQMRRGFLHYLERERAHPFRPFLHHNNGEDIGFAYWKLIGAKKEAEAAEFRATQQRRWREVIDRVGQELVSQRRVQFDAFVHDYEWDDETLVWKFHNGFPDGFRPLAEAAAGYKAHLGVWFSPWGGYPAKRVRVEQGRQQGLETNQGGLALAGPRYYARFRDACLGFLRDQGVRFFKFDGFAGSNSPPGAGEYRSDVEAMWRLLRELREAEPEVFLLTSSGTWASPFWLLEADAIWRGGHDAGLKSAKGSPRQQWITYRDFEVHNRVMVNGPLYPISSLMTHGIMINSGGRTQTFDEKDMIDEIRSFFASGVNTQELYIWPELMTERAWDVLAESARWSRANTDMLADTHWVGGDPAKSEVYGWASWNARKGILSLRNPSDRPASIAIDIAEAFELPDGAAQSYSLRSPWKEDASTPIRLAAGERQTFELKPFQMMTYDATPER